MDLTIFKYLGGDSLGQLGCMGCGWRMRIDRRLVFIGIMLIVLSMTMATQYATTKMTYSYSLVHPSNADIRFIASDNASTGVSVLRVEGSNASGQRNLILVFGTNLTENQNTTYTAAFGIVNEEKFPVYITNISVVSTPADYMIVWAHGDRDALAGTKMLWNKGAIAGLTTNSNSWKLGAGDQNASNMSTSPGNPIPTPWNTPAHVRYSYSNADAVNGTSDYVWIMVAFDIPDGAAAGSYTGTVIVHFRAAQ